MLNSIIIKNIATYDETGIEIKNLNKINFIFGGNGCGKTTISNFLLLQSHSDESINKYSSCSIEGKNLETTKFFTYNKRFRDLNFYTDADIPGVFTIGEENIEQIKQIQGKGTELFDARDYLSKIQKKIIEKKVEIQSHELKSTEKCWSIFKKFESDFKPALLGSGFIGTKNNFRNKILSTISSMGGETIHPKDSILERLKTLFNKKPEKISEIILHKTNPLSTMESSEIWKTVIVGKSDIDLSALINSLNITDWVNQGRSYIHGDICPFCQKNTIDSDFKHKLEEYFDKNFETKIAILNQLQKNYEFESTKIIQILEEILSLERQKESKLDINLFSAKLESLKNLLKLNIQLSRKKLNSITLAVNLDSSDNLYNEISTLIESANLDIRKHNTLVVSHENEKIKVKNDVWNFLAFEINPLIREYEGEISTKLRIISGMEKSELKGKEKVQNLTNEITELNRVSTSVQPAIDEINRLLAGYGFNSFKIDTAEKANHYWIKRQNGDNALHTLSEGEVTFITFLYYLQTAKGLANTNEITSNKVLVIDDPISSLDSNILFIVSTLIKTLISETISKKSKTDVKQIILLTHNIYFHKEISYQFNNKDESAKFLVLRKKNELTSITDYEDKNPISSSYQMLWQEIKESEKSSSISIQNIIRRILENYFKILGKYNDADIINEFDNFEDKKICQSLLHWINDGSHCIPDDLFLQPLEFETSTYLNVFKRIFEHSGHIAHYNMMMGLENNNNSN